VLLLQRDGDNRARGPAQTVVRGSDQSVTCNTRDLERCRDGDGSVTVGAPNCRRQPTVAEAAFA
jgi:hypothetical protein